MSFSDLLKREIFPVLKKDPNPIIKYGVLISYKRTVIPVVFAVALSSLLRYYANHEMFIYDMTINIATYGAVMMIFSAFAIVVFMRIIIRSFVNLFCRENELMYLNIFKDLSVYQEYKKVAINDAFSVKKWMKILFGVICCTAPFLEKAYILYSRGYAGLTDRFCRLDKYYGGFYWLLGLLVFDFLWAFALFFIMMATIMIVKMFRGLFLIKKLQKEFRISDIIVEMESIAGGEKTRMDLQEVRSFFIDFREISRNYASFYLKVGLLIILASIYTSVVFTIAYLWQTFINIPEGSRIKLIVVLPITGLFLLLG